MRKIKEKNKNKNLQAPFLQRHFKTNVHKSPRLVMLEKLSFIRMDFTIIELLVVIAILVVLVSLLLPALRRAREWGKQTFCMNNLKQIGLAFHSYANDYNDYFPAAPYTAASDPRNYFTYMSAPYLNIDWTSGEVRPNAFPVKIYYCPSSYPYNDTVGDVSLSYGYNMYMWNTESNHFIGRRIKILQVNKTIMFADIEYPDNSKKSYCIYARLSYSPTRLLAGVPDYFSYLHNDSLNVLFSDGHAELKSRSLDGTPSGVLYYPGGTLYE